jgi:hypothetical protein
MSQHKKAMKTIEQESGLENLVVRPLSAKLLNQTIPEEKHLIDRKKLLSIQGRRRLPQIELADKLRIKDYPCPAGGCRLTDPGFAKRLQESFKYYEDTIKDIHLLRYGRHFRLESGTKVIVGRNEEENNILKKFFEKNDILIEVIGVGSPVVLLKSGENKDDVKKAATLCVNYSDADNDEDVDIKVKYSDTHEEIMKLSAI